MTTLIEDLKRLAKDHHEDKEIRVAAIAALGHAQLGEKLRFSICDMVVQALRQDGLDFYGDPIHAECAACDCSMGEPHRIADCSREDREVGSDE